MQVHPFTTLPLDELLSILLQQFKLPLAGHGVVLSDAETKLLARQAATRTKLNQQTETVSYTLAAIIAESESVLARWNMTFEKSLLTGMDDMPGWETTAEFIEIANLKSTAELHISAGATLLTALGDRRYTHYLLYVVEQDIGDIDAIVARRILGHVSGIDLTLPDWLGRVREWLAENGN